VAKQRYAIGVTKVWKILKLKGYLVHKKPELTTNIPPAPNTHTSAHLDTTETGTGFKQALLPFEPLHQQGTDFKRRESCFLKMPSNLSHQAGVPAAGAGV
jgi:hypothetical protein